MKVAAQCPHCKAALAVEVSVSLLSAVVQRAQERAQARAERQGLQLQGRQVEAREKRWSCAQATPQARCPECGAAGRIVYGERRSDRRPYFALVCPARDCPQRGRFIPGTFRWKRGGASEAA